MWDLGDAQRDLRPKSHPLVRNNVDPGSIVRVLTSVGFIITLCCNEALGRGPSDPRRVAVV